MSNHPKIELQTGDGTIKGSIFINGSGELVFREAENGNQIILQNDGFLDVEKIAPNEANIASELGLPEYDDVSNGPQTQGRLIYATGNGTSSEGIYRHNGSSYSVVGGGLADGDNFDGQSASDFSNLNSLSVDSATVANAPSNDTDVARKKEVDAAAEYTPDSNSPFTASGTGDFSFSPADTYDEWKMSVEVDLDSSFSGGARIGLQVNNVTSSYTFQRADGSSKSVGRVHILRPSPGEVARGTFEIDGRWNKTWKLRDGPGDNTNISDQLGVATNGYNGTISSPLSDIRLYHFTNTGASHDWYVELKGKDLS